MKINHKFNLKTDKNLSSKTIRRILLNPYLVIMFLLIVLPAILILIYSLVTKNPYDIAFKVNFKNFMTFFSNKSIVETLFISIGYSLIAALIAVLIAYPFAYLLVFSNSKFVKSNIYVLITMPIWISLLLKSIGLQTLFMLLAPQLLGTWVSIVVGMVYMFLPFVILPIYNSLDKIDRHMIEASNDLGASSFTTFRKIILPFSISGIMTGATLLVVQAATSLVIVKYLGAGKIDLIANIIESYFFKGSNFGFGATISVILVIFIFIIIGLSKLIEKKVTGRVQQNEKVY